MLCVYLRGENEHENEKGYKREGKTRDKKLFKSADCDVPLSLQTYNLNCNSTKEGVDSKDAQQWTLAVIKGVSIRSL
jgi:hypothetical protein